MMRVAVRWTSHVLAAALVLGVSARTARAQTFVQCIDSLPRPAGAGLASGQVESAAPTAAAFAGGVAEFLLNRAEAEASRFAVRAILRRVCAATVGTSHALSEAFPNLCTLAEASESSAETLGLRSLHEAARSDMQQLPRWVVREFHGSCHRHANQAACEAAMCSVDIGQSMLRGFLSSGDAAHLFDVDENGSLLVESYRADAALCAAEWDGVERVAALLRYIRRVIQVPDNGGIVPASAIEEALGCISGTPQAALAPPPGRLSSGPWNQGADLVRALWGALQRMAEGVRSSGLGEPNLVAIGRNVATAGLTSIERSPACTADPACVTTVALLREAMGAAFTGDLGEVVTVVLGSPVLSTAIGNGPLATLASLSLDVAQASDAESVEQALERFAAPVGSWEHKHETAGVSLNGYVGATGAYELVMEGNTIEDGPSFGPSLMVGLDLHLVHEERFRFGFFASVLDVGNVVSVRINNGDAGDGLVEPEAVPNIDWPQLLSPGLFIYAGLGRTPFVLGLGASYVPELRREANTDMPNPASVLRLQVFVAVDVTILPLASLE